MIIWQNSQSGVVRQLISLRYLTEDCIQKLIQLITQAHVSIFKPLAQLFVSIRNQMVYADYKFRNQYRQNVDFKHISLYLRCRKRIIADLANIIHQKFKLYEENISLKLRDSIQYKNEINISKQKNIRNPLHNLYPEAYWLQRSIREEFELMKKYFQTDDCNNAQNDKRAQFLKDHLSIKIQSKAQQCNTIVNSIFKKQDIYENQNIKFTHQQFYNIKQYAEKFNYQLQGEKTIEASYNENKQALEQIDNLTPLSAKCAGCIPYMYKNRNLPRQRCALMNVQVLNTLDDKRNLKRFRELVQTFINTKNGGIIFFDSNDLFFSIQPKGFKCFPKTFQQKKQSLIDICKNQFPELKIDKQFYIDFVLLKDPDVILKRKAPNQEQQMEIIGRFRILKEKTYSLLQKRQQSSKIQIIHPSICMNHYIKRLTSGELKQLQMQRDIRADLTKMKNNPNKSQNKITFCNLKYLQGRQGPIVRHDGNNCKQKPLEIYQDTTKKKQEQTDIQRKAVKQQLAQKFQIGKEPLNLIDKNYPFWTLLVVNVNELQKIDFQLRDSLDSSIEEYSVEAPFQNCSFAKSKTTLLIKTTFSHQTFVDIINSAKSQQQKYFRTQKKNRGYVPLVHIKVYDSIFVTFFKKPTQKQLLSMKENLQTQVKNYFSKKLAESRNKQQSWRLTQWIQQLKVSIYEHIRRPSIWIKINDWNPSYGLLYIYYYLKNETSISRQSNLQIIEFKQLKDQYNQHGYSIIHKN